MKSEVSRFREQQEQSEQSAHLGLYGYKIVSPHDFIEKRMEQEDVYLQQLMQEGRHAEAFALMETEDWNGIPCQTDAADEREPG